MIVAANSSSTLITTFTLGATDTASSPVELVHNVPPAAYNTTSASTLVSAGYFLYLGGTRLEIFNNSAESLQPLHSIILSDCESPRRLSLGRGVFGSSLVHIVEAIGLVECKTRVYALFPDRHSDFRLQKRLDVSTDTKASIAVLPRSDNTTIALVTRSGAPIVFSSNLDTGSFDPSPQFPSSITCLPSAPPLQPYGKDEVILHCPNGPRYFCTPDSCESQPIPNLNGVQKLQVAFNKDIAVAAKNSDSITVYRNRFTTMCSINATDRQLFYLTVTSEATILVLVNPTNISLYNLTNGCTPPITVLTTDSALRHNIIGGYLILTTANMYNVTIVDLITGERMYSVLLTRTPLVYQLRLIHSPPSLSPSPSPTTITNSTTSVPSVSSPPVLQTLTSPVIATSSATPNIQPEHTSQSTPPPTSIIPISSTTSNAHSTSSLPSTNTAIPTPTPTFESLPLSITAGVTAAAVILPVLLFISILAILVHCARNRRDKNTFSSSQQTESVSSNGNAGVELASLTKPTPETNCTDNSTSTPSRYTTPYGTSVSSPSHTGRPVYLSPSSSSPPRDYTTDLSTAFTTV